MHFFQTCHWNCLKNWTRHLQTQTYKHKDNSTVYVRIIKKFINMEDPNKSNHPEILEIKRAINAVQSEIARMEYEKSFTQDEAEIDKYIEDIMLLEEQLTFAESRLNDMLQWIEHKTTCEHEFVLDLIDIDPDKSKLIKYCKYCLHVPQN